MPLCLSLVAPLLDAVLGAATGPAAAAEPAVEAAAAPSDRILDVEIYEKTAALLRAHYLWEERLDWRQMFQRAGQQLEERIEWLLVESPSPDRLLLRDGAGRWQAEVVMPDEAGLPLALARLEQEVARAGLPLSSPSEPGLALPTELLRGAVRVLDRHSAVLAGESLERFDERISGTLTGIGATIGPEPSGSLIVKALIKDGPAESGGLKAGDRLVRIDGVSTVGMTSAEAIKRIRGEADTRVVLSVQRGEGSAATVLDLALVRKEILLSNVTTAAGPEGVGVLSIDHFSEQTSHFLNLGLEDLGGQGLLAGGLLIDLRQNTGGSLLQSARAADTFLGQGLLVRTAGRGGGPVAGLVAQLSARPDSPGYAMPLAVLMDHATASGSEILAGALALLDRAILIGEVSFGKGTVQKTFPLSGDIKLKMTVAQYLLAGDRRVHDVGLAPDVAVWPIHFFGEDRQQEIWFPAEEVARRRMPVDTPMLPVVVGVDGVGVDGADQPGTDQPAAEARAAALQKDGTARIAARILRAAALGGGGRPAVLAAALQVLPALHREAEAAMLSAFKARGIDWQAGASAMLRADALGLELRSGEMPLGALTAGAEAAIGLHLQNRGGSLYRAAIRLRSVRSLWEDRVVPLGHIPQGADHTGTLRLKLPAGPDRLDRVEFWMEVPGQAPLLLQTADLVIAGSVAPILAVDVRYLIGDRPELLVSLQSPDRTEIPDLVARLSFPDDPGIELLDEATPPTLIGRKTVTLRLGLRTAAAWSGADLPLELTLSSEQRGIRQVMTLRVPADGSPLSAMPPALSWSPLPLVAPVGTLPLDLQISDDGAMDHLLVLAGVETIDRSRFEAGYDYTGDKIAWLSPASLSRTTGRAHRQTQALTLPVQAGPNRYTLLAEDADGLRTVRTLYVLGTP